MSLELAQYITAKAMKEVKQWVAKYPKDKQRSAVMAILRIVQEEHNFLNAELIQAVADYLELPVVAVHEVVSFYTMYHVKPMGRYVINICKSISCHLCDAPKIVKDLEEKLKISLGETTADGRFSLRGVECLGACIGAPVIQINKDYHENITPEEIDALLENYE